MNTQLKKGVLDLCVLSILDKKDCYGYEIIQKISDYIEISGGTVYPILKKFREEAYVRTYLEESGEGPIRKYYSLTEIGKREYINQLNEWSNFKDAIELIVGGDFYE